LRGAKREAIQGFATGLLRGWINRYLFDLRPDFREVFFAPFLGGTFFPSRRASDNAIATACLRLLTLRPDRPLFKVPALRFFIVRSTLADAFLEYLRAMGLLPVV
jgi:hypothetical protein